MAKTLQDVIRKVEGWEDNLRANAEHSEEHGITDAARRLKTRADDMRDVLEMLREIDQPDDSDLESSAWFGFREQNDIIMAGLPDDLAERASGYAKHYAGGLMVLWGVTDDGLNVKCHDSWGDDECAIVHVYDPDAEEEEHENVLYLQSGTVAVRTFLALVGDL